jgi:hypothetical protein
MFSRQGGTLLSRLERLLPKIFTFFSLDCQCSQCYIEENAFPTAMVVQVRTVELTGSDAPRTELDLRGCLSLRLNSRGGLLGGGRRGRLR